MSRYEPATQADPSYAPLIARHMGGGTGGGHGMHGGGYGY